MHFTIQREALLKPLQLVAGVVERRQTLPVLSNVLLVVEGQQLSLTGTDLEVELVGRVQLEEPAETGSIPAPMWLYSRWCTTRSRKAAAQTSRAFGRVTTKQMERPGR